MGTGTGNLRPPHEICTKKVTACLQSQIKTRLHAPGCPQLSVRKSDTGYRYVVQISIPRCTADGQHHRLHLIESSTHSGLRNLIRTRVLCRSHGHTVLNTNSQRCVTNFSSEYIPVLVDRERREQHCPSRGQTMSGISSLLHLLLHSYPFHPTAKRLPAECTQR